MNIQSLLGLVNSHILDNEITFDQIFSSLYQQLGIDSSPRNFRKGIQHKKNFCIFCKVGQTPKTGKCTIHPSKSKLPNIEHIIHFIYILNK